MSTSASRDSRRVSVTRAIHDRVSSREFRHESTCNGNSALRTKSHLKSQQPATLRRFFSTVPDSSERYLPVPKAYRQAHRRSTWKQRRKAFVNGLKDRIPVFQCVRTYNIKENLVGDIIAGIAAAALQFPQGMAYGLLAGLTPAIGMVSTIFPMLVYIVFGSAAHTSLGTNSIVSAMIEDTFLDPAVQEHIQWLTDKGESGSDNKTVSGSVSSEVVTEAIMQYKISIAAGVTFFTGLIFLLMAILRMGFLMTYLSQSFMSGFTTGVAFHIFSSQVKTALGVQVKTYGGYGKLIKLYIEVCNNIVNVNIACLITTVLCCTIMLLVKILINERLKPKIPIPIEAIVLISATLISHFAKIPDAFGLQSIGAVKMGIPSPTLPAFTPTLRLVMSAAEIVLVTFFLNLSVIKIVSRRNGYEVDENVETNAYALCNIFSSFFSNIPASINPPRVTLLSSMGAKTTFSGVPTLLIMLALMLYFGQFFQSCPLAVLASLIMVSTKDLLKQVTVLPKLWKVNKNDFTTWVTTALACIFIDIGYGLLLGVLASLLSVVHQSQRGWMSVLGKSNSEDLYLDKEDYGGVYEIPGVKIIRMESSLYFATAEKFRKCLYKIIEEDVDKRQDEEMETLFQQSTEGNYKTEALKNNRCDYEISKLPTQENGELKNKLREEVRSRLDEDIHEEEPLSLFGVPLSDETITLDAGNQTELETLSIRNNNDSEAQRSKSVDGTVPSTKVSETTLLRKRSIIEGKPFQGYLIVIDCLPINFIDGTGLDMLKLVILELGSIDVSIYLARCSRYMLRLLEKSDIYEFFPREHVFVDIPDALSAGLQNLHGVAQFCTRCLEHTCVHMEEGGEDTRPKRRSRLMSLPLSQGVPYDRLLTRTGSLFSQL